MITFQTQCDKDVLQGEYVFIHKKSIRNLFKKTNTLLGRYKTEQRAKEVMSNLWVAISSGDRFFSMPKE